jgi:hypothetical protein
MSDDGPACPYCLLNTSGDEPFGGWVYRDEFWLVHHGPIATLIRAVPSFPRSRVRSSAAGT